MSNQRDPSVLRRAVVDALRDGVKSGDEDRGPNDDGGGEGSSAVLAEALRLLESLPDAYLAKVLSAPSKRDPSQPRTVEYARDKLVASLMYRAERGTALLREEDVSVALSGGSLYWSGYTPGGGHPILWVRNDRKDWANLIVEDEADLHCFVVERATERYAVPGSDGSFVIVADAASMSLGQVNVPYMRRLLEILTVAYHDRLRFVIAGPVNAFLMAIYNVLYYFLPRNLRDKIVLTRDVGGTLVDMGIVAGPEDVPDFLGGRVRHDDGLAVGGSAVTGEETIRFDWDTMDRKMLRQREDWMKVN